MDDLISTGLIGLSLGGQYALLALGFTLIFGILGVVNFAHGGFYLLGGYVAYAAVHFLDAPFVVALLIAVLATAALGYMFESLLLERVIDDPLSSLVLTLGLYLVLTNGVQAVFGAESVDFTFPLSGVWRAGSFFVPIENMVLLAASLAVIGLTYAMIYRTNLGRSLRAMAQDRPVARAQGMRVGMLFPLAFAISTGLAGLTGALVSPIFSLAPHVGDPVLATSFLVVILGGLGSIGGATAAAFLVGLVEAYSSVYLGGSKGALVLFVLVLIILVVRPTGLFGRTVRGA
ncbi:branched-chain amino acid ABC transporter permease [Caballeronia sp. LZ065]|uniref:branched-chain amino acid ABC transporter permease n=1 Tax=Caballeronia sp. LZ065 TaxID=3038571 RepID=UPI00285A1E1F|nr:branched-chain amino acid ABC transporter permease [Caballeronia sp. LZ065]MDR5784624.1 branched-chain amino acid ABC transporter permease [Caballeronia sp. LZ065]